MDERLLTIEDLPPLEEEGYRLELINGKLIRSGPFGFQHGYVLMGVGTELGRFAEQHGVGRVGIGGAGFVLARDPDTILAPDIAFVRVDRLPEDLTGFLSLAPDLVAEVISPTDTFDEVTERVVMYLKHGTSLIWLIQPLLTRVHVYQSDAPVQELGDGDVLDGGDVIPGFRLPLAEIFR